MNIYILVSTRLSRNGLGRTAHLIARPNVGVRARDRLDPADSGQIQLQGGRVSSMTVGQENRCQLPTKEGVVGDVGCFYVFRRELISTIGPQLIGLI